MKNFYLGGEIVGQNSDKTTNEDVCPQQIVQWLKGLEKDEPFEVQINSLGGNVFAGIQIYNALRSASKAGHKVTTRCTSIAASIASIILMAGDEIILESNSFVCIHLPWTSMVGNAIDLQKEIQTLEKITDQMLDIYATKMSLDKEAILAYLKDETWFTADEFAGVCDCQVNEATETFRIAASMNDLKKHFNKTDKIEKFLTMTEENIEHIEQVLDDVKQVEKADPVDETVELKDAEEHVTKAECESRVQGMQSSMQKQINTLKDEYENKIGEFKNQIEAMAKELDLYKNESINLKSQLEKSVEELSRTTSALAEKENALATLNANVNKPAEELPTFDDGLKACRTVAERLDFIANKKYK